MGTLESDYVLDDDILGRKCVFHKWSYEVNIYTKPLSRENCTFLKMHLTLKKNCKLRFDLIRSVDL